MSISKARPSTFICDSCDYEAGGYTKEELIREGWEWERLTDKEGDLRRFVMCPECVIYFEERRALSLD